MKDKILRKWQIRILVLCWVAYACIYLGRNNLYIAIPEIQNFIGSNKTQMGIIGSCFFWVYGAGQLINGYVGDKVSSRLYIFIGLVVTALSNIFFGFTASLFVMCILWAVNGFFQSMLWGPMAKTIAHWVSPAKRSSAAIGVSTSMVGGALVAYILTAQIIEASDWKWAFWIPGVVILMFSFVWYARVRNHPKDIGLDFPQEEVESGSSVISQPQENYTLLEVVKKTKLWFIVIACFAQGIVKDGINLWAPTFFIETYKLNIKATAGFIIAIPIMNFGGMMLAGWLNKKLKYRDKITTAIIFAIGILMIIGLITIGTTNVFLGITFLGLSSAMMYGANTILLGVIPMSFAKYNMVSSVAGGLDFCAYIAAGFASSITGLIVDFTGWGGVLVFWLAVTVAGTVALMFSQIADSRSASRVSSSAQIEV